MIGLLRIFNLPVNGFGKRRRQRKIGRFVEEKEAAEEREEMKRRRQEKRGRKGMEECLGEYALLTKRIFTCQSVS